MTALQHEEAGRVDADVVDQVIQRRELALPLRHSRALAALHQAYELHDRRLVQIGVVTQRLDRCPHPRHVAVVIGSDRIDHPLRPPFQLVPVVGDVGGEVGRLAVGAHEHPILVVAKLSRPQPDRALALVDVTPPAQMLDRRLDLGALVQGALREPGVEAHPEALQGCLYPLAHRLGTASGEFLQVGRVGSGSGKVAGQLHDILASVSVLGRLAALHPRRDRLREAAHLTADVVEEVLPLDIVAGQLEQPRERIPVRRPPAGRHGQGPGGVS